MDFTPLHMCIFLTFVETIVFCEAKVIYISPTAQHNTSCPSPCYTLAQLYQQQHNTENGSLIDSNTILFFIGENHVIESEVPGHLVIRDVSNITLLGNINSGVKIVCTKPFGLAFLNITNLTLRKLSIVDCGTKLSTQLVQSTFILQTKQLFKIGIKPKVALFGVNIHSLIMSTVVVSNSSGYGLLGINIIGNSKLISVYFNKNNIISYNHCWNTALNSSEANNCRGGNALFLYTDIHNCPTPPLTPATFNLTFIQCTFYRGIDVVEGVYDPNYVTLGSGLGIFMTQLNYGMKVKLVLCASIGNVAVTYGANFYFSLYGSVVNTTFTILRSQSLYGNVKASPPINGIYSTGKAPALNFVRGILDRRDALQCTQDVVGKTREEILVIEYSIFSHNFGGAILILFGSGYQEYMGPINHVVIIRNSNISGNTVNPGNYLPAIKVVELNKITRRTELVIENSHIMYNRLSGNLIERLDTNDFLTDNFPILSTVRFSSINNVTILNSSFVGNTISAIHAVNSYIYFKGNNRIVNNNAVFGGALYLTTDSVMFLDSNTQLTFENNSALQEGGAIYVAEGERISDDLLCFFQIFDPTFVPVSELKTKMVFTNNSAILAGDALYGGNIEYCVVLSPSAFLQQNSTTSGRIIFDYITNFTGQSQTDSVISSDAINLCFCINNKKDCDNINRTVSKYPGEVFYVSVIGIGQRGGVTSTVVNTRIVSTRTNDVQRIGRVCSNVQYRIASNLTKEYMFIFAEKFTVSTQPLLVKVDLLPCPVGFDLENDTQTCKCSLQLIQRNITECDIDTGIINRLPPYWLSNYSQHLIIHNHCPIDYCKTTPVQITMQQPNISKQCAFNRTGTICGQCEEGLSAVFGTSSCLQCSNKYLALLIPFAVAGIALIVFLFLFTLTVSMGTINGLIFYANFVKINEAIFFPPGDKSPLKVFISWVNLDLGIETCFYNGMDTYAKTWLQFAFPFYIWLILAIILIVLRYSSSLVKLCGTHAVSVLATIFLLSYTKLLRAIITALSLTTLNYPDGTRFLWLYDGNIEFGKHQHLALLLFAIIFLLILVPYTLLLTSVQILRKWSHKKYLKWVSKLMPIFDAYLGPYKDKCGYWTGLCLLVRVVMVLVFVFNILGDPAVNLLVIILVAFVLIVLNLGQGGVYKNNYLTVLEISFIFNLGVLAAATGYVRQSGGSQQGVIYTSTSITLATFISILIYHTYTKLKQKYTHSTDQNTLNEYVQELTDIQNIDQPSGSKVSKTVVEIHKPKLPTQSPGIQESYEASKLREPLLEEPVTK